MNQSKYNQSNSHSHQRDRAVRRSGRVRAALIGGATAASVGIASVLGLTALTAPSASSATPNRPHTPGQQSAGAKQQQQQQQSGLVSDLKTFASGQQVSNGSGPTHATTKGS